VHEVNKSCVSFWFVLASEASQSLSRRADLSTGYPQTYPQPRQMRMILIYIFSWSKIPNIRQMFGFV